MVQEVDLRTVGSNNKARRGNREANQVRSGERHIRICMTAGEERIGRQQNSKIYALGKRLEDIFSKKTGSLMKLE